MNYSETDVIAAPATDPRMRAPLAILRVSGDGCWTLLHQAFEPVRAGEFEPWQARYGWWRDDNGRVDDVMVTAFRGPASYTGQDMFEVTSHGNPMIV